MPTVVKRIARAILLDDDAHLVLFKRDKPGRDIYWATIGGGVDAEDTSVEAALHREVFEELGGKIADAQQVFIVTDQRQSGIAIQHFFVARLLSLDLDNRTGTEFDKPENGTYELVRVPLTPEGIAQIDLKPPQAAEFISANTEGLLSLATNPPD
ncbi:NUDIX hydrolase [Salinactinospora qingdaonensis]|uniref:Nudix hydrolase domain-containing protein n=1 Tax=Salinactinospora qingdaonensis TaxID=702744 RepID=A0ABP7F6Q5_9ACTN